MLLRDLINHKDNYCLTSSQFCDSLEILGISSNSKDIKKGFIFVAVKGSEANGNYFIEEAISNGAAVVFAQDPALTSLVKDRVCVFTVKNTRQTLGDLTSRFYKNPSESLKVVGITGTNGKTTVTYLMESILKDSNFPVGVIGTVNYRYSDRIIAAKNTTPGSVELQSLLAKMHDSKIKYVVMEVSSHSLEQERVYGINFHSAIFTNLTQDHLDYHHSLDEYFQAKNKLFKSISRTAFIVVNSDDPWADKILESSPANKITYSVENDSCFRARDIRFSLTGTDFVIVSKDGDFSIHSPLIGMHNVYNILAAFSWAKKEGLGAERVISAIENFSGAPGRLERVRTDLDFAVFVDYAHTDDALKNVITSLRKISSGKIIVVFGCGGDRDKLKRPKMGNVVSELADFAVITNDNPRSEDPGKIIQGITSGIRKSNFKVIEDRAEAIREGISMARSKDIVLIAGKGHENYQVLSDKTIYFDDRKVAEGCLSLMNS